jgi:hypothetical protein
MNQDMKLSVLKILTWMTVAGAILGALALVAVDPLVPEHILATTLDPRRLVTQRNGLTAAGPAGQPAAAGAPGAAAGSGSAKR